MFRCNIEGLNEFIRHNPNKWAVIVITTSLFFMLIAIIAVACINTDNEDTNYDYIIVGGGIEGAMMAYRLSNSVKDRVLLIEAGPDHFDLDPQLNKTSPSLLDLEQEHFDRYFWQYRQSRPEVVPWNVTREYTTGKGLGGDGAVDNLLFTRGTNYMLQRWEAYTGDAIWNAEHALITFNTLEHYYGTGFDISRRGVSGGLAVTEEFTFGAQTFPTNIASKFVTALQQALQNVYSLLDDYNNFSDDDWLGAFTNWQLHNTPVGGRSSTLSGFLTPAIRKRKNLVVKTDATAMRVFFNPRRRASGVQYYHNSKLLRAVASKEVILCAGPFTPAILQASGIGNASVLEAANIPVVIDNPSVGQNITVQLALDIILSRNPLDLDSASTSDLYYGGAFLPNTIINDPFDDINTSPRKYMLYTFPIGDDKLNVRLVDLSPNSHGTIFPISNNHLRPMNSSDHIFEGVNGQHDLSLMNAAFQDYICGLVAEYRGTGYGPAVDTNYDFISPPPVVCTNSTLLDQWIINNVKVHERQRTGGAAMGYVVNSKGIVINTPNLRVADSSIIPFGVDGTRLGPSMFIADILATQILLRNTA